MRRRSQDEDDEVSASHRGEAPPATAGRNRPPLLEPGTWFLRRFRVERLLGQGGMGAVYAVMEKGRIWALKIVRSEFLDDPDQRRRLLRQGEVLARMRHPNVVQVHEVGLADDLTAWYRMELLDGVTLREELRRRRALSLPLACATLRAAALGAGHLHSFGGVHRDIKPENLFILREPRDVKLLDFGLARLSGTPDTLDAQTHTSCEDGETAGGRGGPGGIAETDEGNGQVGEDGGPVPEENPTRKGLGGVGETASQDCERGNDGKSGTAGPAGTGGTGATLALAGMSGGDGAPGTTGGRGQGGGGGGGAKAGQFCPVGPDTVPGVGASGGGGGAGGCGGKGGGGGQAGGSSLGIVSLGNRLKLTGVTVAVGQAGNGGAGVAGQSGAAGGNGAAGGTASGTAPSKSGCDGGKGGAGGPGGAGGGGRGGYAVGVADAVTPSEAPAVQFAAGTAGTGGDAGPGGAPESAGAPGSEGNCWDFAMQSPCGG
ncbi:MAG TPA: serine/threonine-protein kinase [Sorangium sp.]|nr:serine/threonine-protein kinase [Sorangium sp.]